MTDYRIIITHASGRYVRLSLVRVYKGAKPTRVRSPLVEKVIFSTKTTRPKGVPIGVCDPPRPKGEPQSVFARELQKIWDMCDQLTLAAEAVES